MPTLIDGVPWRRYRPFGPEGPTYAELNRDCLAPLSREQGEDLCFHPFANVISFTDLTCNYCGQVVKEQTPEQQAEAKRLRTEAVMKTYPHLAKTTRP